MGALRALGTIAMFVSSPYANLPGNFLLGIEDGTNFGQDALNI